MRGGLNYEGVLGKRERKGKKSKKDKRKDKRKENNKWANKKTIEFFTWEWISVIGYNNSGLKLFGA